MATQAEMDTALTALGTAVAALQAQLTAELTAIAALKAAGTPPDFTTEVTALNSVAATITTIAAQLKTTVGV